MMVTDTSVLKGRDMRICVFGVGALGGMVAAKLHLADVDVHLFDTRSVMDELGKNGLRLTDENGRCHRLQSLRFVKPTSKIHFDYVILALKAHQIPAGLRELKTIAGRESTLVTMQNGIPWWYFQRHPGEFENRVPESVDPGGEIAGALNVKQVIGSVAYPAVQSNSPGCIRHIEGNRFTFGEPDGNDSSRCETLVNVFQQAGFKARQIDDIRSEIWLKALGNLSFNPVSALTRMTMQQICEHAPSKELVTKMMYEAQQVASALNITMRVSVERRLVGAEKVGHHKTSMLQDLEAGRPMEIDALLGSVVELGQWTGVPTPTMNDVYSRAKKLDDACRVNQQTAA